MAEGRSESQWTHTAHILCMLVNVNRAKGPPATPDQFMPKSRGEADVVLPITVLRDLFVPPAS